jgi:hypothetical protein
LRYQGSFVKFSSGDSPLRTPIHTPSSRPNQKIGDAIKRMLKKVDVVLLCHIDYETPFNPRPMNSEWREKFKSEDCDVIDMVSDSKSD